MTLGENRLASARFPETSWGLVIATRGDAAAEAFAELCRRYWMPVYAALRRQGHAPVEAEDLVQAFFLHLMEHRTVTHAVRERGRFRSFILGALRRFLAGEREREQALKRGGGQRFVPIDGPMVEALLLRDDDDALSLDLQFDRQWALALVDNALAALRDRHRREGALETFDILRPCLDTGASAPTYEALAQRLGSNVGAVKTAVHRLRRRFREALRHEVGRTVAAAGEVDDELAYLRNVLSAQDTMP